MEKKPTVGDSLELQELFDKVASETFPGTSPMDEKSRELFLMVGNLARKMHGALGELGKSDILSKAASQMPVDRKRLSFIGESMERSAEKCLSIAETSISLLDNAKDRTSATKEEWLSFIKGEKSLPEFKNMAMSLPNELSEMEGVMEASKDAFVGIITAQEFHDLAGQTVAKVVSSMADIERDLLEILSWAAMDGDTKERIKEVIDAETGPSADDACTQEQVDDLLSDLGF